MGKLTPGQSARRMILLFAAMPLLALLNLSSNAQTDVQIAYAEKLPRVAESLLLDITRAGERWVAVGERGHIILSEDGENWTQADAVPTRSTLTAVTTSNGTLWAVGHDSVILSSADNGNTWTRNFYDIEGYGLMDIAFVDQQHGFAVGAYGLMMETRDGGVNWGSQDLNDTTTAELFSTQAEESEGVTTAAEDYAAQFEDLGCYEFKECHLNAILDLSDSRLMMLAEKGFGYRSTDNGQSWEVFRLPYAGSMFGAIQTSDECVMAYGLRGHVFESCDFGGSWQELVTGTESSISGAVVAGGKTLLVGNSGVVLSRQGEGALGSRLHSSGVDFAACAVTPEGNFLLVGEDGIHRYPETEAGEPES